MTAPWQKEVEGRHTGYVKRGLGYVNGEGKGKVLFTLRERQRAVPFVILWVLLSLFCAIAGPFGTHDVLTFWPRLGYWTLACGISVALSVLVFGGGTLTVKQRIVVNIVFVFGLSAVIYGLNALLFDRTGWAQFWYLAGTVLVTTVVINGVFWLIRRAYAPTEDDAAKMPEANRFLLRLPLEKRGTLQRLEAQDHYVLAVTDKGQSLVLIRFADALAEVEDLAGLQIHRSHWIVPEHAVRTFRENGRDLIEMADGAHVPVSRRFRPDAKERGLI
jgi:hypothetical protein